MKVAGGKMKVLPKEAIGKRKKFLDEQLDRLRAAIRGYPSESLLAAFGSGLVLGFLVRRL